MSVNKGLKYLGFTNNDYTLRDDGDGAYIWHWYSDLPQPTEQEISVASNKWEADWNSSEYKRLRQPEYPSIGDQLDALLKEFNYRRLNGDNLVSDLDGVIGDWLAVKAKYPKPEQP